MVGGKGWMCLERKGKKGRTTASLRPEPETVVFAETSRRPGAMTLARTSPLNSGWLLNKARSKRKPRELPVLACFPRYSAPSIDEGGTARAIFFVFGFGILHRPDVSTFVDTQAGGQRWICANRPSGWPGRHGEDGERFHRSQRPAALKQRFP